VTLVRRAYFPKATEDEYKAIRARYAEQSETLSETFKAEVTKAVAFIEQFPEASPVSSGRVRKKVLRKPFEYTLFYVIEEERIRILSVAHQKRRPGYWADRF
jgi:toxin ParE1/3/4